jgi:hypothetical protein
MSTQLDTLTTKPILYYGMVKPLPIMWVRHQASLLGQAWHQTQHNGQVQDHSMPLGSGMADLTFFVLNPVQKRFWSLL